MMVEPKLSTYGIWYHAVRASIIKQFGGQCGACRKKLNRLNAQFAHLKPTGLDGGSRGSWNRLHDIMSNPTSYALMCLSCHADYDGERNQWRGQKNG